MGPMEKTDDGAPLGAAAANTSGVIGRAAPTQQVAHALHLNFEAGLK